MNGEYNPAKDAHDSYYVAIDEERRRKEWRDRLTAAKRVEFIGKCIMIQGDCLEVMPQIGKVDAVVTDPPFGMAFQSNHRAKQHKKIANDDAEDLLVWICGIDASHSKYVFCRWDNLVSIPKPKSLVTWVKNNWSMGDLDHEHARQTEVAAFYAGEAHFFPSGRPQDVIRAARTGNEYHPTEKPVILMQAFIGWTDGVVTDPFMGSGTTGVACVKTGREFIGIELDPDYFEIACKRVREAYAQPDMFIQDKPKPAVQEGFAL